MTFTQVLCREPTDKLVFIIKPALNLVCQTLRGIIISSSDITIENVKATLLHVMCT